MSIPDWLTDTNIDSEKEADSINEISEGIRDHYMWPLLALGVPGNLLTIITLLTMGKMSPGAFFIAFLAVSDLAALLTKFIKLQTSTHDVYLGPVGCKMEFLPIYFSMLANWALALIALERFIAVCYPLQRAYLFTRKRSYIAVSIIVVVFLIVVASLFGALYTSTANGTTCGTKMKFLFFWNNVWYWINTSLVVFIPFLLNMAFTVCIIRGLYKSRRDRRSILGKENGGGGSSCNSRLIKETEKIERMLTLMLILASVIFIVLSLPACVYFLAKKRDYADNLEQANWDLFGQIQYVLFDTTHAINFFIYFLSARRFRTHFMAILCCRKGLKTKRNEVSNHTDTSVLSASTMATSKI